jgi:hypothetical protein
MEFCMGCSLDDSKYFTAKDAKGAKKIKKTRKNPTRASRCPAKKKALFLLCALRALCGGTIFAGRRIRRKVVK